MILYLHGFRSSPQSFKARVLEKHLASKYKFCCPQLPASPKAAIEMLEQMIERSQVNKFLLMGSSLGGFYATWLAEKYGCPTILLNPAIHPEQALAKHTGLTTQFHSSSPFEFKAEYLDELFTFKVKKISQAQRYFLMATTGDELLDWRLMAEYYQGAEQKIIQGSDHGISDFENYIDELIRFIKKHFKGVVFLGTIDNRLRQNE